MEKFKLHAARLVFRSPEANNGNEVQLTLEKDPERIERALDRDFPKLEAVAANIAFRATRLSNALSGRGGRPTKKETDVPAQEVAWSEPRLPQGVSGTPEDDLAANAASEARTELMTNVVPKKERIAPAFFSAKFATPRAKIMQSMNADREAKGEKSMSWDEFNESPESEAFARMVDGFYEDFYLTAVAQQTQANPDISAAAAARQVNGMIDDRTGFANQVMPAFVAFRDANYDTMLAQVRQETENQNV